jgi:hypothetical protein
MMSACPAAVVTSSGIATGTGEWFRISSTFQVPPLCINIHHRVYLYILRLHRLCGESKKEGISSDIADRWTYSEAWNGFPQIC